ncbi:nucleotide sugar dehydrogenase [Thermovibrio sp.]
MKVGIVGMGYVGLVGAACLAKLGHEVVGMDVDEGKIELLKKGTLPIYETGLEELFEEVRERITFTTSAEEVVKKSEVVFVCVGTPSRRDGKVDLRYVEASAREIGKALKSAEAEYPVITYRSTIPPGTSEGLIIPILEELSGKKAGRDFGYAFNPEFLREGSAIYDFFNPPKTVVGTKDERSGKKVLSVYTEEVKGKRFLVPIVESELIKYADNTWHAIKVDFANEIGTVAKAYGANGRKVMEIFCEDRKLNISPVYLKPGFAFGGSCLPKDVKGLNSLAKEKGLELPLVFNVIDSNFKHILRAADLIEKKAEGKEVTIFGVAFKSGTDDVRETPAVYLAKELQRRGFKVKYFDPLVNAEKVKAYFGEDFLEISDEDFFKDFKEAWEKSKNVVLTGSYKELPEGKENYRGKKVFDLGGLLYEREEIKRFCDYYSLCW